MARERPKTPIITAATTMETVLKSRNRLYPSAASRKAGSISRLMASPAARFMTSRISRFSSSALRLPIVSGSRETRIHSAT